MQVLRHEGLEGDVTDDDGKPAENDPRDFEHGPALPGTEVCSRLFVYIVGRRL
jgi:hypothetical protein